MVFLVLALLALVPTAVADPETDYRAIHHDWEKDGQIMRCYWTLEQLQNARRISDENPDDSYNDFPNQVDAEIARWRRGDCDGPDVRIARVRPVRERVTLVNATGRKLSLDGWRLVDRQGHRIRLDGLEIGDKLVVRSGKRRIWDDKGDIARLLDSRGKLVSQFGYGRFKDRPRF